MAILIGINQIINTDSNPTIIRVTIKEIEDTINQVIIQGIKDIVMIVDIKVIITKQAKIMIMVRESHRKNATTVEDHGT